MNLTCLLFHHDHIRERDAQGVYILKCERCQQVTRIFEQKVIRDGEAHQQAETLGVPNTKARRDCTKSIKFPKRRA